jgi:hypothetical protein
MPGVRSGPLLPHPPDALALGTPTSFPSAPGGRLKLLQIEARPVETRDARQPVRSRLVRTAHPFSVQAISRFLHTP